MLGAHGVVVPERRFAAQTHPDLNRYLRLEYGGTMTVAAFLSEAHVGRKARRKGPRTLSAALRALANAFRSIATGRPSKIPTPEM